VCRSGWIGSQLRPETHNQGDTAGMNDGRRHVFEGTSFEAPAEFLGVRDERVQRVDPATRAVFVTLLDHIERGWQVLRPLQVWVEQHQTNAAAG
jgi:hypothetical protein